MKRKLPPDQQVIDWYNSGKSTGEIAEMTGTKPPTVVSLLRKLGVPRRSGVEAARLARAAGRVTTTKYWSGKTQPPDMVERRISKIRGENHWLWKGGADRRLYRRVKTKDKCDVCGSRLNLGLHHIDFDHFNDAPGNLRVLCVSCHMSLHKQAYWDAIHAGTQPLKSNGKVGWVRDEA